MPEPIMYIFACTWNSKHAPGFSQPSYGHIEKANASAAALSLIPLYTASYSRAAASKFIYNTLQPFA